MVRPRKLVSLPGLSLPTTKNPSMLLPGGDERRRAGSDEFGARGMREIEAQLRDARLATWTGRRCCRFQPRRVEPIIALHDPAAVIAAVVVGIGVEDATGPRGLLQQRSGSKRWARMRRRSWTPRDW